MKSFNLTNANLLHAKLPGGVAKRRWKEPKRWEAEEKPPKNAWRRKKSPQNFPAFPTLKRSEITFFHKFYIRECVNKTSP
jgi:hypothetical protein